MSRSTRVPGAALLIAALLAAQGCAVAQPPPLDAAQLRTSELAVSENIRRLRGRLFQISYTLSAGGSRRCGKVVVPDLGVFFVGADPAQPTPAALEVLHVVPGSPLGRAGVRPGDVVLEIDGGNVSDVAQLNAALALGRPAELALRRGGERYAVRATPATVCGVPVKLAVDTSLMTFEDDSVVAVPYGLLEAASDDWLAIAIGHQIAHALLEFAVERVDDAEATADRLGLLMAAEAGFDVGGAPAFWAWLASENPWRISSTRAFRIRRPHPMLETEVEYSATQLHLGVARRLPAIRATVAEIEAALRARR